MTKTLPLMDRTLSLKVEAGPELKKYIDEMCEKMKEASKNFPRHPINQDNSRLISLVSRIESLEMEVAKLRQEVRDKEDDWPEDFSADIRSINRELEDIESRIEALEEANG